MFNSYLEFEIKLELHNFSMTITGNNWLNEIIPRLLHNKLDSDHLLVNTFLDYVEDLESMNSIPSPRVITSHLPPRHLPKDHIKNGGKIVHIIRNPKDVALAAFHHYKHDRFASEVLGVSKDLSAFLDLFLKGGTCTTPATTKITFSVAAYGN